MRLAVSVAEYLLDRPLRTVLDIGCGEGTWAPVLRRLRPHCRYLGIDPSPYVVARYGRRRGIRPGRFGSLDSADFGGVGEPFDLVVCADVLHYLSAAELARGLRALPQLLGGVAYLEAFTANDAIEGDRVAFQRRSAATYRRLFREAGLTSCGLHCYVGPELGASLTALERPG